jgi:hypothetical protein
MYRGLADLGRQALPQNPYLFAAMAEGPLDQIRKFQEEIEAYSGVTQIEEHEGDLRETDLHQFSFILRNVGEVQQIPCTIEESLLEAAKLALDRRVKDSGTRPVWPGRRPPGKLHVTRFVVIEPNQEQDLTASH